jgi:hypothetical protein
VLEVSDQGLVEEGVNLERPCRLFTGTNLLTPKCIALPSNRFLLDTVIFGTKFASKLLMHGSRLLGIISRQKGLGEKLLDVPLNERCQIRGQDMRKVAGDIWPQEEFLDLDG